MSAPVSTAVDAPLAAPQSTSVSAPALRALLLDLIAPLPEVDDTALQALQTADWQALLGMVDQHRLGPLLHWQLTRTRPHLTVPQPVRQHLASAFQAATLQSMRFRREWLYVHAMLQQAGIRYLALKGAFLAFHAYAHPALRPMLDLDLLVDKDQALAAYRLLCPTAARLPVPAEGADDWLVQRQHLPGVCLPGGQLLIELHVTLFRPVPAADAELSNDPQFWQRTVHAPIAGQSMPFESPADLLLHLIVHSVIDHKFDNGPLILSDLAYLLDRQTIDWPLFWQLARRGGYTRACLLALKLAEHYWGPRPITWPDDIEAQQAGLAPLLHSTAQLMLQGQTEIVNSRMADQLSRQPGLAGRLAVLRGKAFPPRALLAAEHLEPVDSLRLLRWYPVVWWQLAVHRLPVFLRERHSDAVRRHVQSIARLDHWLAGP